MSHGSAHAFYQMPSMQRRQEMCPSLPAHGIVGFSESLSHMNLWRGNPALPGLLCLLQLIPKLKDQVLVPDKLTGSSKGVCRPASVSDLFQHGMLSC